MSDHNSRRDALRAAQILLDTDVLPDRAEDMIQSDDCFRDLALARFAVSRTARYHGPQGTPKLRDLQRIEYEIDGMLIDRLSHLLREHEVEIPDRDSRCSVVEEVEP
jgi:hypothetical protein